jgi:glutathione synthase/RimK-type ligase-like ATP-grasp enzyme
MNLLLTNTQEEQPYLILRCLRHEANRIVITVSEGSLFKRWQGISAWSRFVSKRYTVPDCSADWRAGRIEADNTPAEEAYIQRIEQICSTEEIDTIFPSYDAEVFVFAKNKERFRRQGITTVTPDYSALIRILDKSLTLEAAQKAGFPTPLSCTPANQEELLSGAAAMAAPWVLKPRCNAHGANICLAHDRVELIKEFERLSDIQQRPLLQEFIPTRTKRNYYLVVSPQLEILALFSPQVHRHRRVGMRTPCAAVESTLDVPYTGEVRALVKELGIWGGMTVQSIVDERDGIPKLMEINPRFGHNLWYRTEFGINEPLIYLRLAQGRPTGPIPSFPEGVLLLDPLWDVLHLLGQCLDQGKTWLRTRFRKQESTVQAYEQDSIPKLLRSFRLEYFSRTPRITSPLNRGYFSDPLPPLVRIVRTLLEAIRRRAS